MTTPIFLWIAIGVATLAAGWDVAARRIPNWTVGLLALAAVAHSVAFHGWSGAGSAGLHALIALIVGMVLFRFGAVGAGDAKLYAAAALAVPLGMALTMLGYTALAGMVLWILMFIRNRGIKNRSPGQSRLSWTLPYGLPIAIAFVLVNVAELIS